MGEALAFTTVISFVLGVAIVIGFFMMVARLGKLIELQFKSAVFLRFLAEKEGYEDKLTLRKKEAAEKAKEKETQK